MANLFSYREETIPEEKKKEHEDEVGERHELARKCLRAIRLQDFNQSLAEEFSPPSMLPYNIEDGEANLLELV
jgi:hypothetical protein